MINAPNLVKVMLKRVDNYRKFNPMEYQNLINKGISFTNNDPDVNSKFEMTFRDTIVFMLYYYPSYKTIVVSFDGHDARGDSEWDFIKVENGIMRIAKGSRIELVQIGSSPGLSWVNFDKSFLSKVIKDVLKIEAEYDSNQNLDKVVITDLYND